MLANRLDLCECGNDAVAEIIGMRARIAHAPDAVDSSHRSQQIGKVMGAVGPRVHGLAEEDDFCQSLGNHLVRFTHDVVQSAAAFRAPGVWHDAVGAAVVAAALHRNPRLHALEATRLEVLVVLLEIEVGRREFLAFARAFEQFRQRAVGVRPDHKRHARVALEESRTEPLRHASRHAEDGVSLHEAPQLPEPADDALFGVLANGARVDENHVRPFRCMKHFIANGRQLAEDELGVADVHLATVGFDVDRRHDQSEEDASMVRPAPSATPGSAGDDVRATSPSVPTSSRRACSRERRGRDGSPSVTER